jgi:aryl-phospho-beta-D-glucosidase BglC (GH1 family)
MHRNILRMLILSSYVLLIIAITFGISSLYSYLNTGADRSKMLHTEIKKIDQYTPSLEWSPLNNKGRPMDLQTLNEIEDDYLDAWYVRHIAYKTNLTRGIDDYYTKNARKNIFNILHQNKIKNITIDETTLEHNITLDFFSEDGQLVVLTDNNVLEYKRIYKNNIFITETYETARYKVILLLEDGFWRIRHLIREVVSTNNPLKNTSINTALNIKGINYYPQKTPWDMFGKQFNDAIIDVDFKIIKTAGLNTIRIFIPYEDFGKAKVNPNKLKKLQQVLDTADDNGLKVMITLFDFYGDYSVLNWTLNRKHAETIVSTFKNHPALIAWDIKNEPDLDFDSRGKTTVISWLKNIASLVKSIDQKHPITIGWSNAKDAVILKDNVDFISFHYYKKTLNFKKTYTSLKKETSSKQVIVTEFGTTSYKGFWKPFGSSEDKQGEYYKYMQEQLRKQDVSFMSWTLYDFTKIPKEVVGKLPWKRNAQEHFGFINKNGKKKKSFKYISSN